MTGEQHEPEDMIRDADHIDRTIRRRAKWWPAFLLVFGLCWPAMMALIPLMNGGHGWAGLGFAVLIPLFVLGMRRWDNRQTVMAPGDRAVRNQVMGWGAVSYLAVYFIIGPHYFGDSPALWALGGVFVALPCFVHAVLAYRRLAQ